MKQINRHNPAAGVGRMQRTTVLFSRTTTPRYRKANTVLAYGKTTHALKYTAGQGQPQGPNNHSAAANATEHNKHCMKADSWPRRKPNA